MSKPLSKRTTSPLLSLPNANLLTFFCEYPENSINSMRIATKDIKRCPILLKTREMTK